MKLKLAAVAVALLLVGTGAAVATPGNAPNAAQADEHAQPDDAADAVEGVDVDTASATNEADGDDAADENDTDRRGPPADSPAPAVTSDAADRQGPPVDLPAQVPGFVTDVHDAVGDHLSGALEGSLGDRISDLTPDDENAGGATNGTATPTASGSDA